MDTHNPDRGPLLLISSQKDHMVPDVATRANYKVDGESTTVTAPKSEARAGNGCCVRRAPRWAAHLWPAAQLYAIDSR